MTDLQLVAMCPAGNDSFNVVLCHYAESSISVHMIYTLELLWKGGG